MCILLQEQTTRLIYSYHDLDPVDEAHLLYHGPVNHRGGKSVSLLTPSHAPAALKHENVKIMDFRMRNVSLIVLSFILVLIFCC